MSRSRRRGVVLFLVFAVLLLASASASVFAAEPESEPAESEGTVLQEAITPPGAEQIQEASEAADRREAERLEWLSGPEATQEREQSRSAFSGIGAADAQALLMDVFATEFAQLNAEPARQLSDAQLLSTSGETVATVRDDGKTFLLDAAIPVRDENEDGELRKVDLSLEESAQGFEPVNPLTSGLVVPDSAVEPIELGDEGLEIKPLGVEDRDAQHLDDQTVYYNAVLPDVGYMVAPIAGGVELFNALYSPNSPEALHYELELPDRAELKPDGNGGAEIVRDQKTLAYIPFPTAVDAQGTRVPVDMEIDGSTLSLHVPHREGDFAYPILVDPAIVEDYEWHWSGGASLEALGLWTYSTNDPTQTYLLRDGSACIRTDWCLPSGRGIYMTAVPHNYPANVYGQFFYWAPGATTYIPSVWTPENPALSAWINPFWRSNHGCSQSQYPNPRDYNGSFDVNGNWLWYEQDRAQWYGNAGMVTKAKGIAFGMTTAGGGYVPCPRSILVGGYGVRLDDEDAPTISNASVPAGWVGDLANFNVTATAADGSLGVHRIRITPNGRGFFELSLGCSGTATNRCPNSISNRPFSVNGNNFNEGERGVQFAALDPTGEPVSNTIEKTIKIDNTPPQITLPPSQLATATAEVGSVEKPAGNGNELELPFYNLVIEAKDYESGAGPSEKRSGVKNVEIYVDNVKKPVPWTAQTCTTSGCPRAMNVTYPLKTTELQSSGDHILKVVAVDQVGEKLTREIEFEYFPATGMKEEYVLHHFPLPDDQGNEAEEEHPRRPELAVNVMNGNLIYRETDIDVESSAGIDLKVDRYYNSLLPDSENTEWGDGWTLGQTPKLDPIPVQEGSPVKARLLRTSAAYQTNVPLPAGEGQTQFDPGLAAVVTMQADGDYEISDATGESSSTAMAFDDDGRMKELQGAGYSRAVYGYDEGKLATIDVTDPATFSANPAELQIEPRAVPSFKAAIGSVGTGNGQMQSPSDVAIDAAGNTWVLEKANNRVQKFNANGEFVSKFGSAGAGNGQFNWPAALAIDVKGNIWIADRGNRRVQKFNANGEYLSRFGSAGTGNGQFAGAGPEGIAIDQKGNIWVSDTYGGRLQKFTEAGAFLKAAGSKGSAPGQLGEPTGIDVGPAGNVWVADWQNHRVSVFNEAGEFVRQFGTQGSGDGKFANPDAIDVDSQGNVWVGDQNNDRIQQFDEEGNFVAKFGSKGSGQGQFEFAYPMGITTDAKGALWVADPDNNRVQRFQIPHYLPAYRSSVGAAGAGDGQLNLPSDVAFDSKANLWVADSGNNRIQGFDAGSGEFVSKFGTAGSGDGQLSAPASLAVDANGDIWVADKNNSRVQKFNAQGEFLAKFGSQGSGNGQLNRPEGIAIDAAGNIWVSDTYNHRIQKFKPNGEFLAVVSPAGLGTIEPTGIDAGPGGKVWVTDWTNNRVVVLSESGELIRQFGTAGSGAGQFNHPDAIEVDAQGKVWVGDEGNGRIQQFNQYGELVAIFGAKGSGAGQFSFSYPFGVAAAAGRLWIADRNNNRIQRWEAADLTPTEINVKVNGDNDPSVELDSEGGLIASIEGIEAGEHSYAYNGQFLVSHNGPEGEIAYEKDPTTGQLKKVTLPNGTYGQIAYRSDGRVLSVTVAPEGSDPKTTTFEYTDAAPTTEARSTRVVPPDAPAVTYDIGADGSVFRWRHVPQAPQFLDL
ncbi:MAG: tripartite motif-containing protein 71, partial [Solirubrobacterales bacterium]|nr:tripartite motif-containing protein 71 [Solirubrobacterales bacterium]